MEVRISLNKMNSGRMQIAAMRISPGVSTGPVVEYREESDARRVLSAFGFSQQLIDSRLELLAEIGPNELLRFPDADVPDEVLQANGFIGL